MFIHTVIFLGWLLISLSSALVISAGLEAIRKKKIKWKVGRQAQAYGVYLIIVGSVCFLGTTLAVINYWLK